MRAIYAVLLLWSMAAAAVEIRVSDDFFRPVGMSEFALASDGEEVWLAARGLTRIRADGSIVDPQGVGPDLDQARSAAYGDGKLVVAYWTLVPGEPQLRRVVGAFDRAGNLLWQRSYRTSVVLFDGASFVLVDSDGDAPGVTWLSPSGELENEVRLEGANPLAGTNPLSVAAAIVHGGVLVTWQQPGDGEIRVARADRRGGSEPRVVDKAVLGSLNAIAAAGSGALLVWRDSRELRAQRVSDGGDLIGGRIDVPLTTMSVVGQVAVVWDGRRYRVLAANGENVELIAIDVSGTIGQTTVLRSDVSSLSGSHRRMVLIGGRLLIAWEGAGRLTAVSIDARQQADTLAVTPSPIRLALVGASAPAVTWVGDHYLAAWVYRLGTTDRIVVRRLDSAGMPLDAAARVVVEDSGVGPNAELRLASNGSISVLAWTDRKARPVLKIAVLDHDGRPLTEVLNFGLATPDTVDVESEGDGLLVAWGFGNHVLGRRILPTGLADEAPALLWALPLPAASVDLAFDGQTYFVSGTVMRSIATSFGAFPAFHPWAALLNRDLVALSDPLDLLFGGGTSGPQITAAAAPERYFVAWHWGRPLLIDRALGSLEPTTGGGGPRPRAVWTGQMFLVSFNGAIHRYGPDGTLLVSESFPSWTSLAETALATRGDGTALLLRIDRVSPGSDVVLARPVPGTPRRRTLR